ncbi:hypothetical protein DRO54_00820 [Candidatus Bathyarchaeota archaeon]|nr:MAG: hypothetical protein DRO54_00820 [Candidatus Bathyarchaeota archaeon]
MKGQRNLKWLFIGQIPILLESYRLAKQLRIEFWLNSQKILECLKLKAIESRKNNPRTDYIA